MMEADFNFGNKMIFGCFLSVDKLKAILLIEADFNFGNKMIFG
jgi:hypothetical protein